VVFTRSCTYFGRGTISEKLEERCRARRAAAAKRLKTLLLEGREKENPGVESAKRSLKTLERKKRWTKDW